MLEKFNDVMIKFLQPVMSKIGNNRVIQSITAGMMGLMILTVGVCIVTILINLPIDAWTNFLQTSGIYTPASELVSATSSLLGIYTVISVSYSYGKNLNQDPKSCVLVTTGVYIALMPQTVTVGTETASAIATSNLGSNGIFIGLVLGILVPMFYNFLLTHNVKISLPEQVPPMVNEAMTPIVAAMIIFPITMLVKWGFSLTSYGDIYSFFYSMITAPLLAIFGTSVWTPIIYCVIRALFWFFGIHPSPTQAVFTPIQTACIADNIAAMMAGEPLPYINMAILTVFGMIGGTGATLGLNICMFRAKSERYKALHKVALVPGLFNINEPLVFGVPIMFNPIMLIPMLGSVLFGSAVCVIAVNTGFINSENFNAATSVAWVIPNLINAFLRGGIPFTVALAIALVGQTLIFYPFFKMMDNQALAEEARLAEEAAKESSTEATAVTA